MKNTIWLNGKVYHPEDVRIKLTKNLPGWERDIFTFLRDWFSPATTVLLYTSGSTGTPKKITVSKTAMRSSVETTGNFFGFKPTNTALLCLPARFIAGKMMLVRAIRWQLYLDYIEPKTQLQIPQRNYYFSAMTPPQVEANFPNIPYIQNLIIGGAPIHHALEQQLQNLSTSCYATYGMTETVSHIALRKTGSNEYTTLQGVAISTDSRGCLVISAPKLTNTPIVTNDLVKIIAPGQFLWLGRFDNIINSGGLKISPETLESKIRPYLPHPFFVAGIPHHKWGEKVVLVIESQPFDTRKLIKQIAQILDKPQIPKNILFVPQFRYTENGKLRRKETLKVIFKEQSY